MAYGSPKQEWPLSSDLVQQLDAALQIFPHAPWRTERKQALVLVAMNANRMTAFDHLLHEVAMLGRFAPDHEEGRLGAGLVQRIQDGWRRPGVGAVVEGQRHARPVTGAGSDDVREHAEA